MLNKETALRIENGVSDGFTQPDLAWSLTFTDHLDNIPCSAIMSSFWIGKKENIKNLANHLTDIYDDHRNDDEFMKDLEEEESVSVLFWENSNFAMCAVLITGDDKFASYERNMSQEYGVKQVLFDGNDNEPASLFNNELITAEEKVLVSNFIIPRYIEMLFNTGYFNGFSPEQIIKLKEHIN